MAQAEKTGAVSSQSQDIKALMEQFAALQAELAAEREQSAQKEAELARHREAEELRKRLGNVDIAFVEGTSKAGKSFGLLKITGGVFGGYGLSLRPATWDALKAMTDQIDFKMREHADKFR